MYWTDTTGNAILRGEYEGGTPEIFLNATNGLKFPEGIAIDWLARNVYWADSGTRTINVANLDTKGTKILLDEKLKNPRGIAVDPSSSRLFWTDWDRKHHWLYFRRVNPPPCSSPPPTLFTRPTWS